MSHPSLLLQSSIAGLVSWPKLVCCRCLGYWTMRMRFGLWCLGNFKPTWEIMWALFCLWKRMKERTGIYLMLKITHIPCEVAAGRWNKLRESSHGWPASFRRCRDASFGSGSHLSIRPRLVSNACNFARGGKGDPRGNCCWSPLGQVWVEDPRLWII